MPSSVIRSVVYHPAEHRLDILFVSGRRYSYLGVPEAAAMCEAPSHGRFFTARIRDRYPFERRR